MAFLEEIEEKIYKIGKNPIKIDNPPKLVEIELPVPKKKHHKKRKVSARIEAIGGMEHIAYDSLHEAHAIPVDQWKSDMTESEIKSFPMVNEPMAVISGDAVGLNPYGVQPTVSYDILWTYFKYTPEIIAVVRAIVEDIMSDGWHLLGDKPNKKKAAERFLMENHAKEQITSMLYDSLVTGDGYLYVKKPSETEMKELISNVLSRPEIKALPGMQGIDEIKSELGDEFFEKLKIDEDLFTPRSFVNIPASTLKALFDEHGNVTKWVQKVGVKYQYFSREEISHFRLLRLDGKFYGFSPMASILKEMDVLANVKDYARYFFEKGGVPNFMFILKNETPNSNNFRQFKKSLQLYASLANKYKNLVVTGEVEAQALNTLPKDMEFQQLATYLTQILIMTWGVPQTRLTDIGIGAQKSAMRGSTISTEGYYRKISHYQDLIEDFINTTLLQPFDVKMAFKPTYPQDELRDAQMDKVMTDTAEQRISLGIWDRGQAAAYMGIDSEDIPTEEEWQKHREAMMPQQGFGTGQLNQNQLRNKASIGQSPEKMAQDADKQSVALQKKSVPQTIIKKIDNTTFLVEERD